MAIFAISGTSGLYIDDLHYILVGRLILGISVAGIFTASTTLIADYYSGPERNKFMGLQGGFMAFGGLTYLSLGGIFADMHWRIQLTPIPGIMLEEGQSVEIEGLRDQLGMVIGPIRPSSC